MSKLGIQLRIEKDFQYNRFKFWLYDITPSEIVNIHYNGNKLTRTVIPDNTAHNPKINKPLLILPVYVAEIFMKDINEYCSKNGVKTENDHHINGKLIATESHLSDLRMITKKLLKIEVK